MILNMAGNKENSISVTKDGALGDTLRLEDELSKTEEEHKNIKVSPGYIAGPMDLYTPWSETGMKIVGLRERGLQVRKLSWLMKC